MPEVDDAIRRALHRAAPPVPPPDPDDALREVRRRRDRRRLVRRLQSSTLAVAVAAATAAGTVGLLWVFETAPSPTLPGTPAAHARIAFLKAASDDRYEIWAVSPDGRRNRDLGRPDTPAPVRDVAWSPEGDRLVLTVEAEAGPEIWIQERQGRPRRLVGGDGAEAGASGASSPAWSPDGRLVAFAGAERVGSPSEIFVVDAAGGDPSRLSDAPPGCEDGEPTWSPDGAAIAVSRTCGDRGSRVVVLDISSGDARPLTDPDRLRASDPAWSPDGAAIAFVAEAEAQGEGDLYVVRPDGSGLRRLTTDATSAQPTWSPDGRQIAFVTRRDGNREIYVMNADGSRQRNVTRDPAEDFAPTWAPVTPAAEPDRPRSPGTRSSPSPVPTPELGFACGASRVVGDFDGDGEADVGQVRPAGDLHSVPPSCPAPEPDAPPVDPVLDVAWGSGAAGSWPLDECRRACRTWAAADLDGDGRDELVLAVDEGASTVLLHVYAASPSEAGPVLLAVAPPGTREHPRNRPLLLPIGGSATHADAVACRTDEDGRVEVLASAARLEGNEWRIVETAFRLDGEADPRFDPKLQRRVARGFDVASRAERTAPFDASGGPPPPDGEPCWEEREG